MCQKQSVFRPVPRFVNPNIFSLIWEPTDEAIPNYREKSFPSSGRVIGPDFGCVSITPEIMTKALFIPVALSFLLASPVFAREQLLLARVTVYWSTGISKCDCAQATGARLRAGYCAVDPKKIPYGSKVLFPDGPCVAVDTGPAVINRRAARLCGRTPRERNAIVIDRFFETKQQALCWEKTHPHFMTVQIVDSRQEHKEHPGGIAKGVAQVNSSPKSTSQDCPVAVNAPARLPETYDPTTAISLLPNLFLRFARRRA